MECSSLATFVRLTLWFGFTTVTSRQMECIFYEGSSFVTVCDKGCCDNKCCEDSTDSTPLVAGVGTALFAVVGIIIIAVVCLTKSRWKNSPCKKRRQVDDENSDEPREEPGTSSATALTR